MQHSVSKTYKITVAYDGTDYYGWQLQNEHASIAGMLESSFKQVFGHTIRIVGASRTDAGVHALGQIASFKTDLNIDPQHMLRAWNGRLPAAIHIRTLEEAPNFYALVKVQQKIYWYHIFFNRPLPMAARYGYWYRFPVDIEKMRAALQIFVGTHDFRSFCTGDDRDCTIRTIEGIDLVFVPHYQCYRVIVRGPGFLKYMIRRLVGAALHVASKPELTLDDLVAVLHAKNPAHDFPTAPAQGLVLRKIRY